MKFDKDLAREILLAIEADESDPNTWVELDIPSHAHLEVAEHVHLLAEAGFIEADAVSSMDGYDWKAKRLTYTGHEFLATVRDSDTWRLTKASAVKAGSLSVQMLFSIATAVAKQKLAEHGILV